MVYFLNTVNLDEVTTNTNGESIPTNKLKAKSVYVSVSDITGSVTVNIEASPDGTNWFSIRSMTYTSASKDVFSYGSYFPHMRTTTTNHSNATVTTIITGENEWDFVISN